MRQLRKVIVDYVVAFNPERVLNKSTALAMLTARNSGNLTNVHPLVPRGEGRSSGGVAMFINWTKDVYIDPVTLTAGPGPNGIPIPTYGNYGGPDYSNGSVGGIIPTSGALRSVDSWTTCFFNHDLAYQNSAATQKFPQPTLL